MEKILDQIMNINSKSLTDEVYDRQMGSIVQALNKIPGNHMVASSGGTDLLEVFSPSEQSVGYLYIL